MTHATHHQTAIARYLRRFTIGLLVAAGAFAVTATDAVDARSRTSSEVVAAEADRALDALGSWEGTHNPADYVRFVQARESAAGITAAELEIGARQLRDEWSATSPEKQQAILWALSQLGVPYRNLKSQPGVGFDCSGLTIWAFDQAGFEIPRNSRDQFRAADEIEHEEAEAGDLVYYPGHVSIYLGADLMVHSPNSGNHVEVVGLPTRHSLRYGDLVGAVLHEQSASTVESLSATLMDRATPVSQ
jgi:cell wall-associated NlpC family hydrolase